MIFLAILPSVISLACVFISLPCKSSALSFNINDCSGSCKVQWLPVLLPEPEIWLLKIILLYFRLLYRIICFWYLKNGILKGSALWMPSDLLKIMSALSSTRKKNSSPRVLCLWFFLIAHSFFSKIQRLCRLHAFFALCRCLQAHTAARLCFSS